MQFFDIQGFITALSTFSASLTAMVLLLTCSMLFVRDWQRSGEPDFEIAYLNQLWVIIPSLLAIAGMVPDGYPWPACIIIGLIGGFIIKGGAEKLQKYNPAPDPTNDPIKKLNRELRKGVKKFGVNQVVDLAKKVKF